MIRTKRIYSKNNVCGNAYVAGNYPSVWELRYSQTDGRKKFLSVNFIRNARPGDEKKPTLVQFLEHGEKVKYTVPE